MDYLYLDIYHLYPCGTVLDTQHELYYACKSSHYGSCIANRQVIFNGFRPVNPSYLHLESSFFMVVTGEQSAAVSRMLPIILIVYHSRIYQRSSLSVELYIAIY